MHTILWILLGIVVGIVIGVFGFCWLLDRELSFDVRNMIMWR